MITSLIANVIAFVIPLRFDRSQAGGIDATLELRIGIRRRVCCFTVTIADGRCEVRIGEAVDPDARAAVALADLVRLSLGDAAWPQLLSDKRFNLTGDPFLALRLPALFRIAAHPRHRSIKIVV